MRRSGLKRIGAVNPAGSVDQARLDPAEAVIALSLLLQQAGVSAKAIGAGAKSQAITPRRFPPPWSVEDSLKRA